MTEPIDDDPGKIAQITYRQRMEDRDGDDSEFIVAEIRRTPAREVNVGETGRNAAEEAEEER